SISLVEAFSPTEIDVTFSEAVEPVSASMFAVSAGAGAAPVSVVSVDLISASKARLSLSAEMTDGAPYSLNVDGVSDLASNDLDEIDVEFDGLGALPKVTSCLLIDQELLLTFDKKMLANKALVAETSYSVQSMESGAAQVYIASIRTISEYQIAATLSPMTGGKSYRIYVDGPTDIYLNSIDNTANFANFSGVADTPRIKSIRWISKYRIDVEFTAQMARDRGIESKESYSLS